jgi:hypothetical protein
VGVEISANLQKVLLGIEVVVLVLFSIVAFVKIGTGKAPAGHLTPSAQWFNPFHNLGFTSFMIGFSLMLFIYWGWDTAVSVNEETKDSTRTPGRAAVISTLILLATYAIVIVASQSYAGVGSTGIGLSNSANSGDVLNSLGASVFGTSGVGAVMVKLLLLMVLTSAAASTQTTILPTARTTLSMAAYKAIPSTFGKVHKRFVIGDSVAALGAMIAFYYGLTGFACVWYYRASLRESARSFWLRGVLPLVGGLMLWFVMVWFIWYNWVTPSNSYTSFTIPGTHKVIGGVFFLIVASFLLGVVLLVIYRFVSPAFFQGKTLNRDTPTRVPDDIGIPVGLFGIEPFADDHVKNEPTGSPT